jgi:hypothetical protein
MSRPWSLRTPVDLYQKSVLAFRGRADDSPKLPIIHADGHSPDTVSDPGKDAATTTRPPVILRTSSAPAHSSPSRTHQNLFHDCSIPPRYPSPCESARVSEVRVMARYPPSVMMFPGSYHSRSSVA